MVRICSYAYWQTKTLISGHLVYARSVLMSSGRCLSHMPKSTWCSSIIHPEFLGNVKCLKVKQTEVAYAQHVLPPLLDPELGLHGPPPFGCSASGLRSYLPSFEQPSTCISGVVPDEQLVNFPAIVSSPGLPSFTSNSAGTSAAEHFPSAASITEESSS